MQIRYKSKVIPNQEEMKKLRKEMLSEMNKLNIEIKKDKKKLLIKMIIYAFIIGIIKTIFGSIELYSIMGYPPFKARFYKVTVNNEPISIDYSIHHKIPIVPFLIHFNSYYSGTNSVEGKNRTTFDIDSSQNYIIDIDSFNCYKGKYQVECRYDYQTMKANEDTRYSKLIITQTNKPYEEIYRGKFLNDISPYIRKKGNYCIRIIAKYFLVETEIYFYLDNKG